ncbi:MAG: hypothetical protein ACRC6B_10980, partial [Fusobacteriaceae bacterium]
ALDNDLNRVGGFVSKSGTILKNSGDLSKLAAEDYNEALQVMSEMQKASVMSFDTMRKMFTGRNVTQIVGVLSQIDGDLGAYNRRMTESSDITKVTEQASKTWVHELTTLKQTISDVSTGMGSFMDAFSPILGLINNGVQSITRNVSTMKALNGVMSSVAGGATFLTTALLMTSAAFRKAAHTSYKAGLANMDIMAGGLGGGIKNLYKEAKDIIVKSVTTTQLAVTGIASILGIAAVAVYTYIKAEKARMRALEKAVVEAKRQIEISEAYGKILAKSTQAAIGGLNPSKELAKSMETLSESFSYALGGSKAAKSAIIDFIDSIVKKAQALEGLKKDTAKTAVEWSDKKNKDSKDVAKKARDRKLSVISDLDPAERDVAVSALARQNATKTGSKAAYRDMTQEEKIILSKINKIFAQIDIAALEEFKEEHNGQKMGFLEKRAYTDDSSIGGKKEEIGHNVAKNSAEYQNYQTAQENAGSEVRLQKIESMKIMNENLAATVDENYLKLMTSNISKASEYKKRLDDPENIELLTPELKRMKKFLTQLESIDKTAFKNMNIEKANAIYSDWSDKIAKNVGIITGNLEALNTDGGKSAKDIINGAMTDDIRQKMIDNNQLTELNEIDNIANSDSQDDVKLASFIKILAKRVDVSTLALIDSRLDDLGSSYEKNVRDNLIKTRTKENLIKNYRDKLVKDKTIVRGKGLWGSSIGEESEAAFEKRSLKIASKRIDDKTHMSEVVPLEGISKKQAITDTANFVETDKNSYNLETTVEQHNRIGGGAKDAKEAMEKFFNLIHFELTNTTAAFEKFSVKSKFSDRTQLLKNNLEVAISTMQDKLISLYESNIDTIEGGKYKDAEPHVKEAKVQSFANNVQQNGNTIGQIVNMGQGIGGIQTQKQFQAETKHIYSQALIEMQAELIDQEKEMLKFLTDLSIPDSFKSEIYGEIANQLQKELDILLAKAKSNNALPADIARITELQAKLQKGFTVDPESVEALNKDLEILKAGNLGLGDLQATVSGLASKFATIDMEKTKEYLTLLAKITEENKSRAKTMQENLMKSFEDMFDIFTDGNFRVKATMENAMKNMNNVIKVVFADTARTLLGMK